jgi:hypothetical protein
MINDHINQTDRRIIMAKSTKNTNVVRTGVVHVVDMSMTDAFGPVVETPAMKAAREQAELEAAFGPMVEVKKSTSTGVSLGSDGIVTVDKWSFDTNKNVTQMIKGMLVLGHSYREIWNEAVRRYPNCNTNDKSIATVKKHMKLAWKEGKGPFVADR